MLHERGADFSARDQLRNTMRGLYEAYEGFHTKLAAGVVQLIVKERHGPVSLDIPSTRLSDGTLHILALFALLTDPAPPPLICIEEPEVGLHPDAIRSLADLLKDASLRTQLIVTTHSDALVDAFSKTPEDVVVCERKEDSTTLRRLDGAKLSAWLSDYSLGATRSHRRGEGARRAPHAREFARALSDRLGRP